jgi:hypothetical protein
MVILQRDVHGGWHARRAQRVVRGIIAVPTHDSDAPGILAVRATRPTAENGDQAA